MYICIYTTTGASYPPIPWGGVGTRDTGPYIYIYIYIYICRYIYMYIYICICIYKSIYIPLIWDLSTISIYYIYLLYLYTISILDPTVSILIVQTPCIISHFGPIPNCHHHPRPIPICAQQPSVHRCAGAIRDFPRQTPLNQNPGGRCLGVHQKWFWFTWVGETLKKKQYNWK